MYRVFNMGVGFVMVVAANFAKSVMAQLRRAGERCWELGKIKKGGPELEWA
jgi:phosphoribosylaminoimidazole (AIR) synthetase